MESFVVTLRLDSVNYWGIHCLCTAFSFPWLLPRIYCSLKDQVIRKRVTYRGNICSFHQRIILTEIFSAAFHPNLAVTWCMIVNEILPSFQNGFFQLISVCIFVSCIRPPSCLPNERQFFRRRDPKSFMVRLPARLWECHCIWQQWNHSSFLGPYIIFSRYISYRSCFPFL